MLSPDQNRPFLKSRWHSFRAALRGTHYTLMTQPNARIELVAVTVTVVAGWWFAIGPQEWAILALTLGVVFAFEAVNTAIEVTVDLVSPDYHPLAGIAKDVAAGAMIFVVLGSIGVAASIFGPRVIGLLLR